MKLPKFILIPAITILYLAAGNQLYAQENSIPDSVVSVSLEDGTVLNGIITNKTECCLEIKTLGGLEAKIPRSTILSIKPLHGRIVEGRFQRFDPNYSRLLYAPTGRPLKKGEGYFSDIWVFFPGFAYGFTDNFTLMAGFSILPGASLSEQAKYIAPKFGFQTKDDFSFSFGALYLTANEFGAGIAFAAATMGKPDKSFTAGLGLGYTKSDDGDFKFADHPILMFGGNVRMSNSTAFVSENWIITGENFDLAEQPFSLAVRFFGEKIAVDVGAIIVLEILDEGFPFPWLAFTYNFGR